MGHPTVVPPAVFALALALASAQEPARLPPVVVTGRGESLTGTAATASEGTIGGDELRDRALLRPGEVLEAIPGVVITQHSGAGKANQIFARGFNLDHGTDLATSLNGVGLNLPSHAHGQGYTDLNLVIPELVDTVRWRLGPYDVRDGDFGSAGAVDIGYVTHLDRGFVRLEAGSYGYARSVYGDCFKVGGGELMGAVEVVHDDGRFTVDQDYAKVNGYVSFAVGDWLFSAHGLSSDWTATDQIARRAVESGQLSRWDSLDPTDGGSTHRYGAQAEWRPGVDDGSARVLAYGFGYDLDLFSNFTYFLNDPVNGDQFEQQDERFVFGLKGSRTWDHEISGLET